MFEDMSQILRNDIIFETTIYDIENYDRAQLISSVDGGIIIPIVVKLNSLSVVIEFRGSRADREVFTVLCVS